jgi:replicative DNA helicase
MQRANPNVKTPSTDYQQGEPFRISPHNIEAEQALLGCILINNEALDRVIDFLEPTHFYDQLHAEIYQVATKIITSGGKATPITMKQYFERHEAINETLSVVGYLGLMAANAATILSVSDYGRTIVDLATRRAMILIAEDMRDTAYETPVDFPPQEQIEEVEARLFSLVERTSAGGMVSFQAATQTALAAVRAAHSGTKTGLHTGLIDLDELLGGLQPTDLVILAGRPGMGKTAGAINIARNAAHNGTPVGFFSLEMSPEQLALRILGEMASVSPDKARRGKLDADALDTLSTAAPDVGDLPIFIDATGGISIAQLSTRARRMRRKQKVGLIVVDYLQLMQAGARRSDNRVQDITAITNGLKALAKELGIPILALSQLSRAVESRDNKRPQLADLRESGSIEQDADVVMFLYREEYYLERDKPELSDASAYADWNEKFMKCNGKAEIIVAKQRQGATGIAAVHFNKELMRFSNLANSERAMQPAGARHGE